jgi:hypothetical protein
MAKYEPDLETNAKSSVKLKFLSNKAKFFKNATYFCWLSIDGSNDVRKSGKTLQTKDYIGLREQGVALSRVGPSRAC